MKMIAMLMALMLSAAVFANTTERKTFQFDGSASSTSLQLNTEETRTEYRTETVARTCYRTMVVGHRQVCRRPTPNQPGHCWTEPIYRTVPYTCYETIRVPYQVFENHVVTHVTLQFGELPTGLSAAELVTVTVRGDQLSLSSQGSKKLILELASLQENRRMNGNVEQIDAVAVIKLHDAEAVKRGLAMSDASIKKSVLTYKLGPIKDLQLAHSLKIVDDPILGSERTLYDAELGDVLNREEQGDATAMSIAFRDVLGRDLGKGRYSVTVKANFKAGRDVLNSEELGNLKATKTIIYTIR